MRDDNVPPSLLLLPFPPPSTAATATGIPFAAVAVATDSRFAAVATATGIPFAAVATATDSRFAAVAAAIGRDLAAVAAAIGTHFAAVLAAAAAASGCTYHEAAAAAALLQGLSSTCDMPAAEKLLHRERSGERYLSLAAPAALPIVCQERLIQRETAQ